MISGRAKLKAPWFGWPKKNLSHILAEMEIAISIFRKITFFDVFDVDYSDRTQYSMGMTNLITCPNHITPEQKKSSAFALRYLINFRAYYVAAFMLRVRHADGDCTFDVFRLSDSVWLGSGEDKDDALHDAAYAYPREFDDANGC